MAEGMPANAIAALGHPQIKTPNLDRLAGNPDYENILADLRRRLDQWRVATNDNPRPGEGWSPEDGFIKEVSLKLPMYQNSRFFHNLFEENK